MEERITRKFLTELGIDEDKHGLIISAYRGAIDPLLAEIDDLKKKVESGKAAYDKVNSEFEGYKTEQQKRETRAAKEKALRSVYTDAGISEQYIPALLRIADYDAVELDESGKAKNHGELVKTAKTENAAFIPRVSVSEHTPATPPERGGAPKMTREEIMAIPEASKRQKAIAENLDIFLKG